MWYPLISDPTIHLFILLKDGGVLQKPSAGIIAVCTESVSCFKEFREDLWQTSPRTRLNINCQDWRAMLQCWQKPVPRAGWSQFWHHCWRQPSTLLCGIYWTIRMNHLDITYSLGGGQVTATLESPTDRSLPMPSTVATESGLVCVCLQGCNVHSKHMQKKRNQHQLVWRPWLVSRYSTVQKCSHQANWAAALLCRYECVREWCVWWTGICPACFLTLIWWVLA